MMNFGYNNRWIRLAKDLLVAAFCVWLLTRSSLFAVIVGMLGLFWYGRDAYYQAKVLWQEKHYQPAAPQSAPRDEKITLGSDAKEVNFEKE